MPKANAAPKPPKHLRPATRQWFDEVMREYSLEPHHVHLLTMAAEARDRCEQAREALAKHGMTFEDRFGQPRARPEIAIERESKLTFVRLLRALGIDRADAQVEDVAE